MKSFVLLLVLGLMPILVWADSSLKMTEAFVRARFETPVIEPAELTQIMAGKSYLLFDVREPQEYAVSHIEGAINLSPAMRAEKFMQRYGDQIADKNLIFYCAVGYRSGALADRIGQLVDRPVLNLSGGIFRWYNEGYPVVGSDGRPTNEVHPYSAHWGRLIKERK